MAPRKRILSKRDANLFTGLVLTTDGSETIPDQLRKALQKNHARAIDLFRQLDDNKSGSVSQTEFIKAMGEFGMVADAEALAAVFRTFDTDGSGSIAYAELDRLLRKSSVKQPTPSPLAGSDARSASAAASAPSLPAVDPPCVAVEVGAGKQVGARGDLIPEACQVVECQAEVFCKACQAETRRSEGTAKAAGVAPSLQPTPSPIVVAFNAALARCTPCLQPPHQPQDQPPPAAAPKVAWVPPDASRVEDPTGRYIEPDAIWAALATKAVRLGRMSWLVGLADRGGILPHRQACPHEAFVDVEELRGLYGGGNRDGVLPIVAISCCWDAPDHPDGRGLQLQTIAAALERERHKFAELGFTEMGVFWE